MAIYPNYNQPMMQSAYPMAYGGQSYQTAMPMPQSFAPAAPMQSNVIGVDGEVGAKAFQIPSGATGPIALWDTNDNVIYMRTFNSAGMPNPLKKLRYVEEEPVQNLPAQSGGMDPNQYVTKDEFASLREEIRQMSQTINRQNQNVIQNQGKSNTQGRQG